MITNTSNFKGERVLLFSVFYKVWELKNEKVEIWLELCSRRWAYIQLIKKHRLEISQPGLKPNEGLTWEMTKRRGDKEVHKVTIERPGWCSDPDPHLPPCAAFVEIMALVFSRDAWRFVWYMIQNDLVHGWGLDFALRRRVEHAHEKIGVVDSQWIVHQHIPSLGGQGEYEKGKAPWEGVKYRCNNEWALFQDRLANADKAYLKQNRTKL